MLVAPMLKMGRNARKAIKASAAAAAASQSEESDAGVGFFSQAVKSAVKLNRPKPSNAQAFYNDLKRLDVKPEELDDMGFLEHFGDRNDVTQIEVTDFINKNNMLERMGVDEYGRRYGGGEAPFEGFTLDKTKDDPSYGATVLSGPNKHGVELSELRRLAAEREKALDYDDVRQKMDILLDAENEKLAKEGIRAQQIKDEQVARHEAGMPLNDRDRVLASEYEAIKQSYRKGNMKRNKYQAAIRASEISEMPRVALADADPEFNDIMQQIESVEFYDQDENFRNTTHWKQANPIVTNRLTDKSSNVFTNEFGVPQSATVIEEIQGDMHQSASQLGRKPVYRTDELEAELGAEMHANRARLKELKELQEEFNMGEKGDRIGQIAPRYESVGDEFLEIERSPEDIAEYNKLNEELGSYNTEINVLNERTDEILHIMSNAPIAANSPMKKTWVDAGVKQSILDAVDQGSDRLFLTSPESQADRYGGAVKNFGDFHVTKLDRGQGWHVTGYDEDGQNLLVDAKTPTFEGLRKIMGKDGYDAALKEIEMTGRDEVRIYPADGEVWRTGHEGFDHMYGNVLPNKINKFGKKYGVQLEDDVVSGFAGQRHKGKSMQITQEMADDVRKNGLPLYTHPAVGAVTLAGGAALGSGALVDMPSAEMPNYTSLYDSSVSVGNTMDKELAQQKANMTPKELSDYNFNNLMAEDAHLRKMGFASYGKVSPELAAYRRGSIIPSIEEIGKQIKLNAAGYLDAISSGNMNYTGLPDYEFSKAQGLIDNLPKYREPTIRKAVEPMLKERIDPRDKRLLKDTKFIADMIF